MPTEDHPFPLADYLGMRIDLPESGRAVARLDVGERHLNPHGVVHGAVLFTMVDTAMGAAVLSVLEPGRLCASTDVQIRFVRAVSSGTLEAATEVTSQGRRNVILSGRVTDASGETLALATGAFAALG